jgi:hypothetical protein
MRTKAMNIARFRTRLATEAAAMNPRSAEGMSRSDIGRRPAPPRRASSSAIMAVAPRPARQATMASEPTPASSA